MPGWLKSTFEGLMRALEIPKKSDIDDVEERITITVQSNHSSVMKELKEHDERVEKRADDNRKWLENRFDRFIDQIMLNSRSK